MGATIFWLGEWFIKRMPFVKYIYSASKQISAAISPGEFLNQVYKELILHYLMLLCCKSAGKAIIL